MATLTLRGAVYKRKQKLPRVSDKQLRDVVEHLPPYDREVVKYILGLGRKRLSPAEVGQMPELHGGHVVKQARVYQEFHQAIQKVRELLIALHRS